MKGSIPDHRNSKRLARRLEYPAEAYSIFRHKEYHEVIDIVYHDMRYAYSVALYENLTDICLRNLLAIVFHNKDVNIARHQRSYIAKMVAILKSNLLLLDYIEQEKKFNKKLIFGFLFCDPVPEVGIDIFSEVFLNYAKYAPNQTIKIFKDPEIQDALFWNLFHPPIYKVIYTAIFCLDQEKSATHPKFIPKFLQQLLFLVFQDETGHSVFEADDKCYDEFMGLSSHDNYQETDETEEHEPHEGHKIETRKMTLTNSESASEKPEEKPHYSFFSARSRDYRLFRIRHRDTFVGSITDRLSLVSSMLEQILRNISGIYLGNLFTLLKILFENCFIEKMFLLMRIVREADADASQKDDCLYQALKLCNWILLAEEITLENREHLHSAHTGGKDEFTNIQSSIDSIKSLTSAEAISEQERCKCELPDLPSEIYLYHSLDQHYYEGQMSEEEYGHYSAAREISRKQINQILRQICLIIINEFSSYEEYEEGLEREQPRADKYLKMSMDSRVERITLSKHEGLRLSLALFEFLGMHLHARADQNFFARVKKASEKCLHRTMQKVGRLLRIAKWNNIAHAVLTDLLREYLKAYYHDFYHEVVEIGNVSSGFLGLLIEEFRNRIFVFIGSGQRTDYGNRHVLFTLCKMVNNEFIARGDSKKVYEKFPLWKEFIHRDIEKYQLEHSYELCPDLETFTLPQLYRHRSLDDSEDEDSEETHKSDKHRRQRRSSIDERMLNSEKGITPQADQEILEATNHRRMTAEDISDKNWLKDFSLYYRALGEACRRA